MELHAVVSTAIMPWGEMAVDEYFTTPPFNRVVDLKRGEMLGLSPLEARSGDRVMRAEGMGPCDVSVKFKRDGSEALVDIRGQEPLRDVQISIRHSGRSPYIVEEGPYGVRFNSDDLTFEVVTEPDQSTPGDITHALFIRVGIVPKEQVFSMMEKPAKRTL